MNVPVWAYDLASDFWATVGFEEGFPREFENAIESAYPLTVKRLPNLTLGSLREWLQPLGIPFRSTDDRALCGCLAANHGSAMIFIDATDPADEQRFSLAHELAHFLRDIWRPRQRLTRVLGETGTKIFDGRRGASNDDCISAALESIDLSPNLHLLARGADGRPATMAIADAEESADVLAFELLAPATHLADRAEPWQEAELLDHLGAKYGIPRLEAIRYAKRLCPPPPKVDSWIEAVRAAL